MNKIAIFYYSIHHLNTFKLLKKSVTGNQFIFFDVIKDDLNDINFNDYNKVILASGIYYGKMGKNLNEFIELNQDHLKQKEVMVVITSGVSPKKYIKRTNKYLLEFGISAKYFGCKAHDTYSFLRWIGGINKDRPNEEDVENLQNLLKKEEFLWDLIAYFQT